MPQILQGKADPEVVPLSEYGSSNFTEGDFPAVLAGFGNQNPGPSNASSILTTYNENNDTVAVGYARPQNSLVDWLLIIEQSHDEAWQPINKLKTIVLSCVFGTVGLILIIIVPIAHFSVRPIRRLRDATKKSIAPPGYTPDGSIRLDGDSVVDEENVTLIRSKKGIMVRLRNFRRGRRRKLKTEKSEEGRRRSFKIPAEVGALPT
jgi:osomolarity two-component system sensor histidine kinase SLN1